MGKWTSGGEGGAGDNPTPESEQIAQGILDIIDGGSGNEPPVKIEGFTKHGINQAIDRKVSPEAINDAIKNPNKVVKRADGSRQFRGGKATVVLNAYNQIITLWRKSSKKAIYEDITLDYKSTKNTIKTILNEKWDPIGVFPEIEDEYDIYIPHIIKKIDISKNEKEIQLFLIDIELNEMGLISDEINANKTSLLLYTLKNHFS